MGRRTTFNHRTLAAEDSVAIIQTKAQSVGFPGLGLNLTTMGHRSVVAVISAIFNGRRRVLEIAMASIAPMLHRVHSRRVRNCPLQLVIGCPPVSTMATALSCT